MINKLIIDDTNVELNDKSPIPYSYVFAQANTHVVKYGIDKIPETYYFLGKGGFCYDRRKTEKRPDGQIWHQVLAGALRGE